jgi:hypothetical protein
MRNLHGSVMRRCLRMLSGTLGMLIIHFQIMKGGLFILKLNYSKNDDLVNSFLGNSRNFIRKGHKKREAIMLLFFLTQYDFTL